MKKIKELFDYYFNVLCTVLLLFLVTGIIYLIYLNFNEKNNKNIIDVQESSEEISTNTTNDSENKIKVDIKGYIKKPGVYEINNGSNIYDLIQLSGGLTKNGTTDNINLSKKLKDEMTIVILSKNELKKKNTANELEKYNIDECKTETIYINECIEKKSSVIETGDNTSFKADTSDIESNNINIQSSTETKLISINKASKEELLTIPGIGEAKALSIVEYREKNGMYNSIGDIKKVSGIGEALFEKIKEYITI